MKFYLRLVQLVLLLCCSFILSGQSNQAIRRATEAVKLEDYPTVLEVLGKDTLIEGVAEKDYVSAQLLRSLALLMTRRHVEAKVLADELLAILEQAPDTTDPDELALALRLSAEAGVTGMRNETKRRYYLRSLALYESGAARDTLHWLATLAAHAKNLTDLSETQAAIETSWFATDLAERTVTLSADRRWRAIYDASIIHYRTDQFEDGLLLVEKAIRLAKETTDRAGNLAAAIHERSIMYGGLNMFKEQEADLRSLIAASTNDDRGILRQAISRHSLALNLLTQGHHRQAIDEEKLVVPVFEKRVPRYLSRTAIVLGQAYAGIGQYDQAIETYNDGLAHTSRADLLWMKDGLPRIIPDSVEQYSIVRQLLNLRARALVGKGRLDAAEEDLESIFHLTESRHQRATLSSSQEFISFLARTSYDNVLNVYGIRYRQTLNREERRNLTWKALQRSDQAKAYSLAAALGEDRYDWSDEERNLRYAISKLEREVVRDTTLRASLAAQRLELRQMRKSNNAGVTRKLLNREAVDRLLAGYGSELLNYHLGEESTHIIHWRPGADPVFFTVPTPDSLSEKINRWRSSITEGGRKLPSLMNEEDRIAYDRDFITLGNELRRYLLPDELSLGPDLLIVPDGILNYLPFSALPMSPHPVPLDYHAIDYLGDKHVLSYTQSIGVLMAQQDRDIKVGSVPLLIFAPTFTGETDVLALNRLQERGKSGSGSLPNLSPLVHNRLEADQLATTISGSEVFTGSSASKNNFLRELTNAYVIHLATHGVANTSKQQFSYVSFSQENDTIDAGQLLYFNELSILPLGVEMVVLSACETNLGPILRGEGIQSMATAFTAAGARSTVTTLWSVEDEAMRRSMKDFYAALAEGQPRRTALQSASGNRRQEPEYAHPKYWAGIVLHGVSDPIDLEKRPVVTWWWFLLPALILLGYWFYVSQANPSVS